VKSYPYGTLTEGTGAGRSVNEEIDQRWNHLKYQIKGNYVSYDSSKEWPILNKINKLYSPAYAGTARA